MPLIPSASLGSVPALPADARQFLERRTPDQWHAIARLLVVDGPALAVHAWVIDQAACDTATLAMIFWRLRTVPRGHRHPVDVEGRNQVLARIADRVARTPPAPAQFAWNGVEAVNGVPLIDAPPLPGIDDFPEAAELLRPPFGRVEAEIAVLAFLDEPYEVDDIFDDWWMHPVDYAGIIDLLDGKGADDWLFAVEDMAGAHPEDVFDWMAQHRDCTDAVAAAILSWHDTPGMRELILGRWMANGFAHSGIDYTRFAQTLPRSVDLPAALRDPPAGRQPAPSELTESFAWYVASVSYGNVISRPRSKAESEWRAAKVLPSSPQKTPWINPDPAQRLIAIAMLIVSAVLLWWLLR